MRLKCWCTGLLCHELGWRFACRHQCVLCAGDESWTQTTGHACSMRRGCERHDARLLKSCTNHVLSECMKRLSYQTESSCTKMHRLRLRLAKLMQEDVNLLAARTLCSRQSHVPCQLSSVPIRAALTPDRRPFDRGGSCAPPSEGSAGACMYSRQLVMYALLLSGSRASRPLQAAAEHVQRRRAPASALAHDMLIVAQGNTTTRRCFDSIQSGRLHPHSVSS